MIIQYSIADGLQLLEPHAFNRFKVVLVGVATDELPLIDGVMFSDRANALVRQTLVSELAGTLADPEWLAAYAKMVEAARRFGWIDSETGAICAHVERAAA